MPKQRWHSNLPRGERAKWEALGLEAAQKKLERYGGDTPEHIHMAVAKWATEERRRAGRVAHWNLIVSGAVLFVTVGTAIFTWWIWDEANRPDLVSSDARLLVNREATPPEWVSLSWGNMGKRSAVRGVVTLFTVSDDGKRQEKFSQSEITGSGSTTTLTPSFGYGSAPLLPVDMHKFLGLFLACVKYNDEDNYTYRQTYLFRLGRKIDTVAAALDELPSLRETCPK